jgi:ribosome-associated heat shock protein Hsp15
MAVDSRNEGGPADGAASLRLDVWLWAARFFKTRSLAQQAIANGRVEVGGARAKPARALHVGDRLRIVRGEERFEVIVQSLDTRRGPASRAALLYRETAASIAAREAEREQRRLGGFDAGARPDKQQRRDLRRLRRGGEAR